MTLSYDAFHGFCMALPATTHVVQWGNADVFKVGGKVYAIGGWERNDADKTAYEGGWFTFKVTPLAFEVLKDMPGLRPAPYLASRGMTWIQHYDAPGLSDDDLKEHIRASYEIVAAGLPKKKQRELGLLGGD